MMLHIPQVLSPEQVADCRRLLQQAPWADGRSTAGFQSAMAKDNLQLPEDCAEARQIGALILQALERNPLFIAAALPSRIFPPLFNCYQGGQSFGIHVDNAIRTERGSGERIRTDLSATLFFTAPDEYDGGELVVEDTYGAHSVKLPAGDMILYPRPACTRSCRSLAVHGSARSSGCRAWCATMASAACCSIWTPASSVSTRNSAPSMPPACSSPASTTTCCGAGRCSRGPPARQ